MQKNSFKIRVMTRKELDTAIDWAAAEGWNPGLYDAECFYRADPEGFLIGLLDNEPIATISVVKYSDNFGFLGLYIVKPGFRGMGYGMKIWNAGMAYLRDCNIGLDGVVAQQNNYSKSGFKLAHRNIRYQGIGGGSVPTDKCIIPLSQIRFEELCAYDHLFFPGNRTEFLKSWINQPQGTALAIKQNCRLAAYGVMRRCRSGYKLGPLFADSPGFAGLLFTALKANAPGGSPIFLDILGLNTAAFDLVNHHNMTPVFETARMYTRGSPDLPLNRIFGITSFELG
jgi:GNAT superfamily N-acetyltransferase